MSELAFIENYKDLLSMIDIHTNIIENCLKEREYYQKQMHSSDPKDMAAMTISDMPKGNYSPISLKRVVENIRKIDSMLIIEYGILDRLKSTERDIKEKMDSLQGLYFKVAIKKSLEKKSLQQIADELGYSLGYIKNVSANLETYDFDVTDNAIK